MNSLDYLKSTNTVVVADTGEFNLISKFKPQDATTNPSLILSAVNKPEYSELVSRAISYGKSQTSDKKQLSSLVLDRLLVEFGKEILSIIPGRVSTEVDPQLSFNKDDTIRKARFLIDMYESIGISKDRVLIKIASTWEGIQAAAELEKNYGIHCNLTLIFSFTQAVACCESNVTLISPFVGRVLDWYKNQPGFVYSPESDPGVTLVKKIYNYFKKWNYKTIIMGASFRNIEQIKSLAGCDYLTISPKLLDELYNSNVPVLKQLDPEILRRFEIEKVSFYKDKLAFQNELNLNVMASEKLKDGINDFIKNHISLKKIIDSKL